MNFLQACPLETQNSGPAARPGPKFKPDRAFCGAQINPAFFATYHSGRGKSAGLMLGSGEAMTMYYALVAGFVQFLNDAGRARCWAQQIWCGAGLDSGLAFGYSFCVSSAHIHKYELYANKCSLQCKTISRFMNARKSVMRENPPVVY